MIKPHDIEPDVWATITSAEAGDSAALRRLIERDRRLARCEDWYTPPIHFAVRAGGWGGGGRGARAVAGARGGYQAFPRPGAGGRAGGGGGGRSGHCPRGRGGAPRTGPAASQPSPRGDRQAAARSRRGL